MALGELRKVVVCEESGTAPAPAPGSVCAFDTVAPYSEPVVREAYVLLPGAQTYVDGLEAGFDYQLAGGFFVAGFVTVMLIYLFSYQVGQVLSMIDRAR